MSKDAYYFSHDSNARNDQRLMKVRMKYGMEGYGIYFGIIEIMRENSNYIIYESDIESIAYDLRVEAEHIKDILYNYWLFEIGRDGNKEEAYFFSKSLKRRMEHMDEKKKKRQEAGRLGGIASAKVKHKVTDAKAVKKSKVNKTKENEINKRYDKFEDDVRSYQSLFGEDTVEEFINYWTEENKSGTKMKFEMQPTWDTKRRIQRWAGNDFSSNKTNGISKFKKDANGKFWIGYCSKCNVSAFYDDMGIKQDSKCCQSKLMPEKTKSA